MDQMINTRDDRKILQIPISQVIPGMVTARDVYSHNDQLVVTKNVKLEPNMIAKLMFYAISTIAVYDQTEEESSYHSFNKQVRMSPEYKSFQVTYKAVIDEVKDKIVQLAQAKVPLNEQDLIQSINKVMACGKCRYHMFELIYCIHEFDDMTFAHSINVAIICNVFAEWLHLSEKEKNILTLCGLLHDIGKMTIPKEILEKPDKLTPDEFDIIKKHPEQGYMILLGQNVDKRVCMAALQHHERFDGQGYPLGRNGKEIEPYSMIVAIADVFDAMTSRRVYRAAMCPFSVLNMFEEEGKYQYDLAYLMPLMERIAEVYINHTVRLSNQMFGEIIMLNRHALSKPVVKVKDNYIDLSKHHDIVIEEVI